MEKSILKDLQMTEHEFATLGGGVVAYIKILSAKQATKLFPDVVGIPKKGKFYSLHGADGTPLALTDTLQAARGHAIEDDLEVASVH
jgi:hypothetical protein